MEAVKENTGIQEQSAETLHDTTDHFYFDAPGESPEKAYWLGFVQSQAEIGATSVRFKVRADRREHVAKLMETISCQYADEAGKSDGGEPFMYYTIPSLGITQAIQKQRDNPPVPAGENWRHWLRGVFDSSLVHRSKPSSMYLAVHGEEVAHVQKALEMAKMSFGPAPPLGKGRKAIGLHVASVRDAWMKLYAGESLALTPIVKLMEELAYTLADSRPARKRQSVSAKKAEPNVEANTAETLSAQDWKELVGIVSKFRDNLQTSIPELMLDEKKGEALIEETKRLVNTNRLLSVLRAQQKK